MKKIVAVLLAVGLVGCDEIAVRTSQLVNAKNGRLEYVELTMIPTWGEGMDAFCANTDKVVKVLKKWSHECRIESGMCGARFRIPLGKKDAIVKDKTSPIAGLVLYDNGDVYFSKTGRLKDLNKELAQIHPKLKIDFDEKMTIKITNDCKGGLWLQDWFGKATSDEVAPYFVDDKIEIECSAGWRNESLFRIGAYVARNQRESAVTVFKNKVRTVVSEYNNSLDKWTSMETTNANRETRAYEYSDLVGEFNLALSKISSEGLPEDICMAFGNLKSACRDLTPCAEELSTIVAASNKLNERDNATATAIWVNIAAAFGLAIAGSNGDQFMNTAMNMSVQGSIDSYNTRAKLNAASTRLGERVGYVEKRISKRLKELYATCDEHIK